MKIVCEACQAKYSIADEKVRGKVFKIRCKKCSHVIVVRGSGEVVTTGAAANEFSASAASSPDISLDAGWHIVVDGEQVGPLSEADVRARLSRGEITSDTYIWREGLSDWVKVSTLAEFGEGGGGEAASPFSDAGGDSGGFEADGPTAVAPPGSAQMFAPGTPSGGVPAISELFSAPGPGVDAATAVTSSPGFQAFEQAPKESSYVRGGGGGGGGGGNGALGVVQQSGLTGQRHENSVLFSLANLEALAKPSAAPMALPQSSGSPVSSSTTTEGSGLIDIRAMANMTLGGVSAKGESRGDDLPAFSAPQFSPVAPVLLPSGSGTPRWAIVVLSVLGAAIIALGVVVVKMFTATPQGGAPPVAAAPAPAVPPPAPVAPVNTAPPAEPPTTPPPVANEALPPREPAAGKSPAGAEAAGERAPGRARPPGARRGGPGPRNTGLPPIERPVAAAAPASRPAEAPRKPKDDIEALLEAASGNRRAAAPPPAARREAEEEPPARAADKAPPLERDEIVAGHDRGHAEGARVLQPVQGPGRGDGEAHGQPGRPRERRQRDGEVRRHALGQLRGDCPQNGAFSALGRPDLRLRRAAALTDTPPSMLERIRAAFAEEGLHIVRPVSQAALDKAGVPLSLAALAPGARTRSGHRRRWPGFFLAVLSSGRSIVARSPRRPHPGRRPGRALAGARAGARGLFASVSVHPGGAPAADAAPGPGGRVTPARTPGPADPPPFRLLVGLPGVCRRAGGALRRAPAPFPLPGLSGALRAGLPRWGGRPGRLRGLPLHQPASGGRGLPGTAALPVSAAPSGWPSGIPPSSSSSTCRPPGCTCGAPPFSRPTSSTAPRGGGARAPPRGSWPAGRPRCRP